MPIDAAPPVEAEAQAPPERRGGLIVPVPEAEALVQAWQARYARGAQPGVPAHVTLLFPFLTLDQLDAAGLADLHALFGGTPSIRATFGEVGLFPEVAYLKPEPRDWFVRLTEALSRRFGLLPYGGIHAEIVPHLTVAMYDDPAALAAIAEALVPALPILTTVREAWLMEEAADGHWDRVATFPLRPAPARSRPRARRMAP
jgi:2'-5' RNA ligase